MYKKYLKRILDFSLALVAILLLSPFFILIILILISLNGSAGVFFLQDRPGYHGKPFKIIKFKTMNDKKDANGNLLPDIQRITKFGKIVRKLSIDELPQLFNIIAGDMSIIGPRPLLMQYLPLYSKEQFRRHNVRPGITGWAQCHGRNNISWTKKFELDVWYVDHLSFRTDIKILWMTIARVLKRVDIDNENDEFKECTMPLFDGTN